MKRRGNNKKGFTMIELMIVITVIGILAIVLLPRIAGVRNESRTSGVETNLRAVQGQAEFEIGRYQSTTPGADSFAKRIKARLEDDESIITNPITGNTGAEYLTQDQGIEEVDNDDISSGAAVTIVKINESDGVSAGAIKDKLEVLTGSGIIGRVAVIVYLDSEFNERLGASLAGYDHNGDYIPESFRVIRR